MQPFENVKKVVEQSRPHDVNQHLEAGWTLLGLMQRATPYPGGTGGYVYILGWCKDGEPTDPSTFDLDDYFEDGTDPTTKTAGA